MAMPVDTSEFTTTAPPRLRWQIQPARDKPLHCLAVMAGLVTMGMSIRWLTGLSYAPWLGGFALALSLWRLFLPVEYQLGPHGIDQWIFGRHSRRPWRSVGRYEISRFGVLLLPRVRPWPLDILEGVFLSWSGHRDEVLAHLRYHVHLTREPLGN